MGLDVIVPGTGWASRVGSYGWFHSFRLTVARALEHGRWGRRFPHLQLHSDCDGDYPPPAARALLQELATIRTALHDVPYPCVRAAAPTFGPVVAYMYGRTGCFGATYGVEVGVTPRGLVLRRFVPAPADSRARIRITRTRTFARIEQVGDAILGLDRHGAEHRLTGAWAAGARMLLDTHTAVIASAEPADQVFATVLDALEAGARLAVETGQPLVFC